MKSHPAACLAVAALGMAGVKTFAQDWPQWRGPSSHGVSTETGLPTTGNESENVAWRVALAGLGTSSPIVWGDRVIVTSQVGSSELADGAEHPRLARDDGALAGREPPIGGRRHAEGGTPDEVGLVVQAFRRSDGERLWEYRTPALGPLPAVPTIRRPVRCSGSRAVRGRRPSPPAWLTTVEST